MILRKLVITSLILLFASNASAGAKYDSEKNIVELTTPILAKNIDVGFITIHSENFIKILAVGFDKDANKSIGMCGKDPSLGLLFLDGKLKIGEKVPAITDVEEWPDTAESGKKATKAGWVRQFVLKGDDALDLMDLLYEYHSVGFAMTGKGCTETEHSKSGKIILNFETRGLERAMKRIK